MTRRSIFLLCTLVIYLAFLTRSYFWDGVMFSLQIEHVYNHHEPFSVLFHANHLLYSAFGYLLYAGAQAVHLHARAITLLQIWNALVALGAAYRIWRWSENSTGSVSVALLSAGLFAFGATWWKFATDADPYMISIRLLLVAILFAADGKSRLYAAGVCHIGAMLFHELAVFGYIPIAVAIGIRRRQTMLYVAITAGITWACYEACYHAGAATTHPTLLHWVTNYAGDTSVAHSARQVFGTNLVSYGKLFAGGKLSTLHERLLLFFLALIALVLCLRTREQSTSIPVPARTRWILWSWFIPYVLFLAWFDPGNAAHKLFLWPPLVLLLTTTNWSQRHVKRLMAVVLALTAWNFGAFILPHSRAQDDPLLSLAHRINRELPTDATVYYSAFIPDDWYLDYFAPGRKWQSLATRDKNLASTVCFDGTALEKQGGNLNFNPALSWQLVDGHHSVQLKCLKR